MKIDISQVPFSIEGSYLAVSQLQEDIFQNGNEAGIYIRSIHGSGYMPGMTMMRAIPFCARIVPVFRGKEVFCQIHATTDELVMESEYGTIKICFAGTDTLLICGEGNHPEVELRLPQSNFLQNFSYQEEPYILMNCRTNDRRLAVWSQTGQLEAQMRRPDHGQQTDRILCRPVDGRFEMILEDVHPNWSMRRQEYCYEECRLWAKEKAEAFYASMPEIPDVYREAGKLASYVMWSGIVKKEGLLTRNAMLMAKNQMCNVWSWDHCFNAIALSYGNPDLAWEQFILLFDYQDAMGALPDSVSDFYIARAFCKPPIHGWALSNMMNNMALSREQCEEAYEKLKKWTSWWLDYRDSDGDGICEYAHGHDSGWDNATVFCENAGIELPDLAAFLIIQMEVLSGLADTLGKADAGYWKSRSEKMLEDMLEHSFTENAPRALVSGSHREIKNDCLLLYIPVILGKRLPKPIREHLISVLKHGDYLTDHGFASEAVSSSLYEADGYWRGPIWAPSTLLLVEGLYKSGEKAFACEIAKRFCDMVSQSGCAENYDAVTGEGLRDRAYTWTASVFMILAHEYSGQIDQ